ncbi:hypothetical protein ABT093_18760 [Kitasatospora sp. NPDC002551]|uniref:hypothetical protein n=1 Tax=Kitasatospora sp. NPDC002551 TaxID=3154539 RepID=UPI00331EBB33
MTHRPAPTPLTRAGGALLAAAALVPAAGAWYLFGVALPDRAEQHRSYTAATACPPGGPGAGSEECVRTVAFTVAGTVVREAGKSSEFRATLDGAPFWSGEVRFADAGPVLRSLKPGDRVEGTVWRGRVTRLERAGHAQASYDEPSDDEQLTAGMGTFAALLAVLAVVLGVLRLTGRPSTVALARTLFVRTLLACGAPAVLAFWADLSWWTVPAAAVPTALIAAEAVRRRHRDTGRFRGGPLGFGDGRLPA